MTKISISSFDSDFKVSLHSHNPFVQELIVGDTLKFPFLSNTLLRNRLFPVRYLPTIEITPSGFLRSRRKVLVYSGI
jgi:hypothetical protein